MFREGLLASGDGCTAVHTCSSYKTPVCYSIAVEEIRLIRDPEAIRIVSDSTRRNILSLLRVKEMTASEIAGILEKDQSTIYRHLEKLHASGLVIPSRERKTHHIPEKVYTRTARIFLVAPDLSGNLEDVDLGRLYGRAEVTRMLRVLEEMGYVREVTPELVKEARRLILHIDDSIRKEIEGSQAAKPLEVHTLLRLEMLMLLIRERKDEAFRGELESALERIL